MLNRLGFVIVGIALILFGALILPDLLWPYEGWNACDVILSTDVPCSFSWIRFLSSAGVFSLIGLYVISLALRRRRV